MASRTRIYIAGVVAAGAIALIAWRYNPPVTQPLDEHRQAALTIAKTMLTADLIFDRFLAAGTLLEAGDRAGYEILLEGLVSADPTVARAAMDTLLSVPDFCALTQTISDVAERPMLNEALLRGIAYFDRQDALPFVRISLNSSISSVRIAALRTVARLHDRQSLGLVQTALKSRGMMDNELANVYYALSVLGDGTALQDEIIALTRNNDSAVREIAAVALGNIHSQQSRDALALLVKDQNTRVSVAALGSHINVGGEQSIEALVKVITTGRRDDAVIAAAALKRVPVPIARRIINRVAECCELQIEVALRLMETWGWIGGDDGHDFAIPAWGLRHGDPDVRLQSVWALGWRAEQEAQDLVLPYLKDPDPAMRGMAAWAMARTGQQAGEILKVESGAEAPVCPVHYRNKEELGNMKSATLVVARRKFKRG